MTREEREQEYIDSYREPDGCLRLMIITAMTVVIVSLIWIITKWNTL